MSKRKYRRGPLITSTVEAVNLIVSGRNIIHAGAMWDKTYNSAFIVNWQLHRIDVAVKSGALYRAVPA